MPATITNFPFEILQNIAAAQYFLRMNLPAALLSSVGFGFGITYDVRKIFEPPFYPLLAIGD